MGFLEEPELRGSSMSGVFYAFRRKGQDSFCTCDERRYLELKQQPDLFEVVVFYTAPQPAKREPEVQAEIDQLRSSLDFYKRRADALQKAQQKMRDPERTIVCDILANGHLLVPDVGRYASSQPAEQPLTEEQIAAVVDRVREAVKDGAYQNPCDWLIRLENNQ